MGRAGFFDGGGCVYGVEPGIDVGDDLLAVDDECSAFGDGKEEHLYIVELAQGTLRV